MPDTYALLTPPFGHATWEVDDPIPASQIDQARENFVQLSRVRIIPLGGIFVPSYIQSTSYVDADVLFDMPLCADEFLGFTVDLLVWLLSPNGVTTAQMQFWNVDDASQVGQSTTSASATPARQVVSLTLPSGSAQKFCRPRIKSSDLVAPGVAGWMALRIEG